MSPELLSLWVIYERPLDYPAGFVLRRWSLVDRGDSCFAKAVPTDEAYTFDSLEAARGRVPTGLLRLERDPLDELQIREVWL